VSPSDPNSVGGLVFYDGGGNVKTGGLLTDSPVAAYVEGQAVVRAGDTKATLYGYLPGGSGEQLSRTTIYPNTSAPAPLDSSFLPIVTGNAGDESLATLIEDFPSTDGIYELRVVTSAPGKGANTTYDSILVSVDTVAGTWQL
jgi:hypothetical protein